MHAGRAAGRRRLAAARGCAPRRAGLWGPRRHLGRRRRHARSPDGRRRGHRRGVACRRGGRAAGVGGVHGDGAHDVSAGGGGDRIMSPPQRGGPSMRRFARLLALPLLLLLAAPSADAQTPKRGGVFRVAEREAPGLDPHLSISFLTHSYVSLAYGQLVRFPNGPEQKSPTDFSILPDLAEKWTVSKDGTLYTFHLRKGVHFHNKPPVNGREVSAEDVKYSLERFMAKPSFRDRFEPVQAVDVVDRYTVRITLKEPYAPFLNHLANPSFCAILPREAEDKFKDFNHPDAVIGTGPFVLKSYEKGVRVVYERNPTFYMKGFPYLDGATIDITPDAAARLAVLRAGKAELPHVWGWISPEEARSLKQTTPDMMVTPYRVIGQGFIYMRTDQPPFNDVRVR